MRHLSKVKSFYSYSNFENVIHGFIAIPLDYCNALYVCVSHANFHSSNWVKMLLLACLLEPVTWSVSPLSWPAFTLAFRILLHVFKAFNGLAPPYSITLLS